MSTQQVVIFAIVAASEPSVSNLKSIDQQYKVGLAVRLRFGKDSFEVNPRYLKRNAVRVGGLVKPLPAQKYMNASIAVQDAGLADP